MSEPRPADSATHPATSGSTSVIIVAADSGAGLSDCVADVLASTSPVEVIVSDNASSDGSIEAVAARWPRDPRVRIVHNGKNLGFGAGCNRGAAQASGDTLLFLNPDCRLGASDIETLRRSLDRDATIGLLGALIVAPNGDVEPASRRRDPLMRRALMTISGLSHWENRWPALEGIDLPPPSEEGVERVEAISGAVMMMPRETFERLQGFDEGYFLHCEDLDFSRRVRDAGANVACATNVRIVHGKGGSSRHRPVFVSWHKHRGMWRWFTKFDPAARNPFLRVVVWCGVLLHFAALTPVYLFRKAMRAQR